LFVSTYFVSSFGFSFRVYHVGIFDSLERVDQVDVKSREGNVSYSTI